MENQRACNLNKEIKKQEIKVDTNFKALKLSHNFYFECHNRMNYSNLHLSTADQGIPLVKPEAEISCLVQPCAGMCLQSGWSSSHFKCDSQSSITIR